MRTAGVIIVLLCLFGALAATTLRDQRRRCHGGYRDADGSCRDAGSRAASRALDAATK